MNMIPEIIGLLAVATFLFSYQQKREKILYSSTRLLVAYIFYSIYCWAPFRVLCLIF